MSSTNKGSLWGRFLCLQGRHKVSDIDLGKLRKSEEDEYETMCARCGKSILLVKDAANEEEYYIEEIDLQKA